MNITTILGSPVKQGNTATVLGWLEEELHREGHEVNRINIIEHDVRGCIGCRNCRKVPDAPGCVQEDDAQTIFDHMIAADALIYASPLYCWGFSSQMKALIDRHYCLVKDYKTPNHRSFIEGKPTALLVTCGGPVEDNADLIQEAFERVNRYCKSMAVCKHVVPSCTTPDAVPEDAKQTAQQMVRDLLNALR